MLSIKNEKFFTHGSILLEVSMTIVSIDIIDIDPLPIIYIQYVCISTYTYMYTILTGIVIGTGCDLAKLLAHRTAVWPSQVCFRTWHPHGGLSALSGTCDAETQRDFNKCRWMDAKKYEYRQESNLAVSSSPVKNNNVQFL